jgi:hypothetical protein
VRDELRHSCAAVLVTRSRQPVEQRALASIARRCLTLDTEIGDLDQAIKTILDAIAMPLLEHHGVGYETAGALLCTAGDNAEPTTGSPNEKRSAASSVTSPGRSTPTSAHHRHNHNNRNRNIAA